MPHPKPEEQGAAETFHIHTTTQFLEKVVGSLPDNLDMETIRGQVEASDPFAMVAVQVPCRLE